MNYIVGNQSISLDIYDWMPLYLVTLGQRETNTINQIITVTRYFT
jgi:hypothetical protein